MASTTRERYPMGVGERVTTLLIALVVLAVLAVLIAMFPPAAASQNTGGGDRPRIGLVLGGGGARGAAHIGVLQVLQEERIPVDLVVGTSMGAVVGGLWAAGVDADAMEQTLAALDWSTAFRDRSRREHLSYRRKEDDEELRIGARVGLQGTRVRLPLGAIQGHRLEHLLRTLTLGVAHVQDFDRLPLPFRAVATDIVTGERVVLGRGDLVTAMRASMSVPAVFVPVEWEDHLLVDGGLVDNVPIDVARDLGADVVIVVHVGEPLAPREKLDSPLAITDQVLSILLRESTRRQLARLGPGDVEIHPELGDLTATQFDRAPEMIAAGVDAAREKLRELARFRVSAEGYQAWRRVFEEPPLPHVTDIQVETDSELSPEALERRIESRSGALLDLEQLEEDLRRINGMDLFEAVTWDLEPVPGDDREASGDGEPPARVLTIRADRHSWGPNYLRFGLNLEDDLQGENSFGLGLRYTATQLNRLGAEVRADLRFGELQLGALEYYQPLAWERPWFVAPRISYLEEDLPLVVDGRVLAEGRRNTFEAALDLGRELGSWGELRFGVFHQDGRIETTVGDLPSLDLDQGGLRARLAFDTLDARTFPTRGVVGALSFAEGARDLGSDFDFRRLSLDVRWARNRGRHTLEPAVELARDLQDEPQLGLFDLGGLFRLSGLQRNDRFGAQRALVRLIYRYGLGGDGLFSRPTWLGGSLEAGNVWDDPDAAELGDLLLHGSLFIGLDTTLGPILLATGFGEGGDENYYFLLGRTF